MLHASERMLANVAKAHGLGWPHPAQTCWMPTWKATDEILHRLDPHKARRRLWIRV